MKKATFIIIVLSCTPGQTQEADSLRLDGESLIARQVEHLATLEEFGLDISELTAELQAYLDHPLNLNDASKSELISLHFLDDVQVKNLVDYRNKYGEFLSIYELQAIAGFGRHTIEKIMPFVTIAPVPETADIQGFLGGRHEAIMRFQRKLARQAGYSGPEPAYPGDPARLYFRYRYKVRGKISLGLIMEKDPGEKYFSKKYGPDFLSFHAAYKGKGVLRSIIAGDFHARFGQGLVLWTGLTFSGGSDPSSVKRYAPGISPNTSANENSFFRGVAATTAYKKYQLTILYSNNKTDANIDGGDTSHPGQYVTSFPSSGYHRTSREISDRNSLNVQHLGGNIKFLGNRFQLGASVLHSLYGLEINKGSRAENIFKFSGRQNLVLGMDYSMLFRRTNIFGELAISQNRGWALLSGVNHTTDNGAILCLLVREYRKDFQNLMAGANGRRDQNSNERGIRIMFEFPLARNWTMNTSWDYYKFPWLTYGNISPVRGMEIQAGLHYNSYSSGKYSAAYRYRHNTFSSGSENGWTNRQDCQEKHDLKIRVNVPLSSVFNMLIQARHILTQRMKKGFRSAGTCLAADLHFHPENSPVKIVGRYAIFNTDDYESRIYLYENDVLYASSIPAYYGKGSRLFLLVKYSAVEWLDTWLRFSMTVYTDRTRISSGNDEIRGNKLPEIKLQIRVKL